MKKILSISFVLVLAIGLTACEKPEFLQKKEVSKIEIKENPAKKVTKEVKTEDEGENKDKETSTDQKNDQDDQNFAGSSESEDEIKKTEKNDDKELTDEKESSALEKNPAKKEEVKEKTVVPVAQQTLLILDASGSMWGQIDGTAKIEIAKDVVKKTVKNFENTELGLMAYGHRRKGDCSDIEILTSPKKDNAKNISDMVDGISPKGMTPMGDSVLMAAESLKYTEQKATVILVSDGIETCDVDLCELGKKLEETGVDFTAHVIGFDMTEEQTIGLKCLASETGGTFNSAKNADDLSEALEETVEAASCSKEKLGAAIITVPEKVNVNQKFGFTWTGPNNRNDKIGIFPKDETDWNNHLYTMGYLDSKNGQGKLTSPIISGEYDVIYFADCGSILGRTSFLVEEVTASLNIPQTVTAGGVMNISWTGPNNHNDAIGVFPKGSTEWNDHLYTMSYLDSKNGQGKLTSPLEIGDYDVLYWLGGDKILDRKSFTVTEATANLMTIPQTISKETEFEITWTGPKNKGNAITILPKGSSNWNDHVGGNLYNINDKNKGNLTTPKQIGEYDVVYWLHGKKILDRKTFTVTN